MATLGEIKRSLRIELDLHPETRLGKNPMLMQEIILRAADEVAGRTDCLGGGAGTQARTATITANQATYCLADYYRVNAVLIKTAAGKWQPLFIFDTPGDMDTYCGGAWRNENASDPARAAIFSGVNTVTLYPTPSITRAAALRFEGWRKPGTTWRYDPNTGAAVAIADTQECPLPSWAQEAVRRCALYNGAKYERHPDVDRFRDEYEGIRGEIGRVEAMTANHHANAAHHSLDYSKHDRRRNYTY